MAFYNQYTLFKNDCDLNTILFTCKLALMLPHS